MSWALARGKALGFTADIFFLYKRLVRGDWRRVFKGSLPGVVGSPFEERNFQEMAIIKIPCLFEKIMKIFAGPRSLRIELENMKRTSYEGGWNLGTYQKLIYP